MLSRDDGDFEIKATAVELKKLEINAITEPTEGKKVTAEEFEKISEEKIKEMKQMHGSGSIKRIRR